MLKIFPKNHIAIKRSRNLTSDPKLSVTVLSWVLDTFQWSSVVHGLFMGINPSSSVLTRLNSWNIKASQHDLVDESQLRLKMRVVYSQQTFKEAERV